MEKNRTITQRGMFYRSMECHIRKVNKEERTIEMSFSSELPYERYFGVETLDHAPESVRLDRLNGGGPLLVGHDPGDQVGVIERAWVSPDRKGRALVRFGRSARAEEIYSDVQDGIRRNVSVGYDIKKMILEKQEGGIGFYRAIDWEPLEISLVSIPADMSVGIGREITGTEHEIIIENSTQKILKKEEKVKMEKCSICGAELVNGACPACARATRAYEERIREERNKVTMVNEILAIGRKHDLLDEAQRYISEGKTVQEFKDLVIERISAKRIETDTRASISIADQPIYRGSPATMLGQQLLDIRTMAKPEAYSRREVDGARSRLEQTEKRNRERMLVSDETRAAATGGLTISSPTDGGLFLQGETAVDLITNGFNNSEILPRTAKRTLDAGTQFTEIYGVDETSRATGSRGAGIRVYTNTELGSFTASKPQFKKIRVEPTKLTGLYYASGEWVRNVTFLGQEMRQLFGEEFAFKCQDLVVRGSGAGEALGVLNSGCLVSVAKETGQAAATINTTNLSKMWARFSGRNPVWFINRDCGPQLDVLSIPAGTGALEPRFVTYDAMGILRIKGAPVIEIEQCETVGTVGDIMLCDWGQYLSADKGDIMEASSIHVEFIYDQETFRFIMYFDGQPRWSSAIRPYKGSNTVSPFVALATRS